MTVVYLGLGSNLDDPENQLKTALKEIAKIDQTCVLATSSMYRSSPLGPADQPDFINCVVKLETELSAHILLAALQKIEERHGRTREVHWGPRTLDLDILLYGDMSINDKNLTVPHPEMVQREFVLIPLQEIAPDISIPGNGQVSSLIAGLGQLTITRVGLH